MKKKKVKPVIPQAEEIKVKSFFDMVAPSVVKFFPDHFICGNTYRCVWALREYPTSTDEQAILRHLGEKNGVTLRIYTRQVSPTEEKRIIHNATNKNKMIDPTPMTCSRWSLPKVTFRTTNLMPPCTQS